MNKIKFLLHVFVFLILGCSSLSKINVCNNTGATISIEQYKAPNYYYIEVKNNECKKVYKHTNFIIKNKKKYIYDLEQIVNKDGNIQINQDLKLYLIPNENSVIPIHSLNNLKVMQPKGFPISPIKKESILNDKKSLK